MKAIVLCGGFGTRLLPYTKDTPKHLLEVAHGKKVIDFVFERIEQIDTIDELFVITNNRYYDSFVNWAGMKGGIAITVVNGIEADNSKKVLEAIVNTIEMESISEDIVIVAGDTIYDFDFGELNGCYEKLGQIVVCGMRLTDKTLLSNYGVACIDRENVVTFFEEKPKDPKSAIAVLPLYYIPKKFIPLLTACLRNSASDELGGLVEYLYNKTKVYCHVVQGITIDIGTAKRLEQARQYYKEGAVN